MPTISRIFLVVILFIAISPVEGEATSRAAIEKAVRTVLLHQLTRNINKDNPGDPRAEVEMLGVTIASINRKSDGVYDYHFVKGKVTFTCTALKPFMHKNKRIEKGTKNKGSMMYHVEIVEDGFGQMTVGGAPTIYKED